MSRLTYKSESGMTWFVDEEGRRLEPCEMSPHHSRLAIEKLAHYEDLEETGRLIEIPCKVGDTVYTILYGETEPFIICEMRIISVKWNRLGWFYEPNEPIPAFRPDNFGKTVFLTKAEAEVKLAELKEGGSDDKIN